MWRKYPLQNRNHSHTNFNQLHESYTSFLVLPFLHPSFTMSGLKHLPLLSKPCPVSPLSCCLKMPAIWCPMHTCHIPNFFYGDPWAAWSWILYLFYLILEVQFLFYTCHWKDYPQYLETSFPNKQILSNFFITLALEWCLLGTTFLWFFFGFTTTRFLNDFSTELWFFKARREVMAKLLLLETLAKSWRNVLAFLSLEHCPGGMVAHWCEQQHGYQLVASPKNL